MIDSVIEMIYACDNCGFLFSRSTEPDQCPDCGKSAVRSANEVEREEFTARMNGQAGSEPSEPYPDAVETAIEEICCFKFKLPATALQIDSRMIMEIVVEHWINPNDQDTVMANVWARPVGGTISGFLIPLHMQAIPNEPTLERAERIVAELNESGLFMEQLHKFIIMMINSGH